MGSSRLRPPSNPATAGFEGGHRRNEPIFRALDLHPHLIWAPPKRSNHPWKAPAPTVHPGWLARSHPSASQRFGGQPPSHPGLPPASELARREMQEGFHPAPMRVTNPHGRGDIPRVGMGSAAWSAGPARGGLTADYSLCLCISVHNAPRICILQCALN